MAKAGQHCKRALREYKRAEDRIAALKAEALARHRTSGPHETTK